MSIVHDVVALLVS